MARALLIVPHFWDPVCVPLGAASLRAYARERGHEVALFDFNTVPEVFHAQREYFDECKRQFPAWANWNIERNGTEMLALHQLLFLRARSSPHYRDYCAEILNVTGASGFAFDPLPFDEIFARLYARVRARLAALLDQYEPEVLGCSLYNSTWAATSALIEEAKRLRPRLRTAVGGPGPSLGITARGSEIEAFFNAHPAIDYYVTGEGEEAWVRLLSSPELPRSILSGEKVDFPALPAPDYGELDVRRYLHFSLASSRGCPYACSFCAETVYWKGYRSSAVGRLLEQACELQRRYGKKPIYLCDSLINPIVTKLTEGNLRAGAGLTFDGYLRADSSCADPARARAWREGGLTRARFGTESASQRILDAMVKKTTVAKMQTALQSVASAGIRSSTLWIVGYPGETEAEFSSTLEFIRENRRFIYQADAWLFQFHPEGLAGSERLAVSGLKPRFGPELAQIFGFTHFWPQNGLSAAARFDRLERFVRAMRELAIPNPYSVFEWLAADQRWQEIDRARISPAQSASLLSLNH